MKYVEEDLFVGIAKNTEKLTFIPHICNNVNAWGAGFVLPLAEHFPEAREAFYEIKNPVLGETQFVPADNTPVFICNMFAQDGVASETNKTPIKYDALEKCMIDVQEMALRLDQNDSIIACPLFGAGLAGGDWEIISGMINSIWSSKGIDVEVYFLPQYLPKNLRAIKVGNDLTIIPREKHG